MGKEPTPVDPHDPNQNDPPPDENAKHAAHEPLPDNDELHAMLRRELEELADDRGVDVSDARTKEDVIEALRRDARKRHR